MFLWFNPICAGYFCLIMPRGGRGIHSATPCVNPDKKMLFDMKFSTVILCDFTKKMVEKNFQNCSYKDDDVANYVNFF